MCQTRVGTSRPWFPARMPRFLGYNYTCILYFGVGLVAWPLVTSDHRMTSAKDGRALWDGHVVQEHVGNGSLIKEPVGNGPHNQRTCRGRFVCPPETKSTLSDRVKTLPGIKVIRAMLRENHPHCIHTKAHLCSASKGISLCLLLQHSHS